MLSFFQYSILISVEFFLFRSKIIYKFILSPFFMSMFLSLYQITSYSDFFFFCFFSFFAYCCYVFFRSLLCYLLYIFRFYSIVILLSFIPLSFSFVCDSALFYFSFSSVCEDMAEVVSESSGRSNGRVWFRGFWTALKINKIKIKIVLGNETCLRLTARPKSRVVKTKL